MRIRVFVLRPQFNLSSEKQFPLCQIDPIEYVEDICENMQLFPKEDFLTGDQLMFEFKPDVSSQGQGDTFGFCIKGINIAYIFLFLSDIWMFIKLSMTGI